VAEEISIALLGMAALGAIANAADAAFCFAQGPYADDALDSNTNAQTMPIHRDRHQRAYVDNFNKAVGGRSRTLPPDCETTA
jgi:Fe-Mn family superoxide dismutase